MNEIKTIQLGDAALGECARKQQENHRDQQGFLRCPAEPADQTNDAGQGECSKFSQHKMHDNTGAQCETERNPAEHIQTLDRRFQ